MLNNFVDINQCDIKNSFGQGPLAEVFLLQSRTSNERYTLKIFKKEIDKEDLRIDEIEQLIKDVKFCLQLEYPAITKFIDFQPYYINRTQTSSIISEFISARSLQYSIQLRKDTPTTEHFTDTIKLISIYGVAKGMQYLHSQGVIHCNLKPTNVIMDKNEYPHVTDYALSHFNHRIQNMRNIELSEILHGSVLCFPPEFLENYEYTKESDVFAFSMMVYEIMTTEKPFKDQPSSKIIDKIKNGIRPKLPEAVPLAYQNLIKKCWNQDPKRRPTFGQIVKEIESNEDFITDTVTKSKFFLYVENFNSHPIPNKNEEQFDFSKFDPEETLKEDVEVKKGKKKGKNSKLKKAKSQGNVGGKGKGKNAELKKSKSQSVKDDKEKNSELKKSKSQEIKASKSEDSKDKSKKAKSDDNDKNEKSDKKDKKDEKSDKKEKKDEKSDKKDKKDEKSDKKDKKDEKSDKKDEKSKTEKGDKKDKKDDKSKKHKKDSKQKDVNEDTNNEQQPQEEEEQGQENNEQIVEEEEEILDEAEKQARAEQKEREEQERRIHEEYLYTISMERTYRNDVIKQDITCSKCKDSRDYESLYKEAKELLSLAHSAITYSSILEDKNTPLFKFYKKRALDKMEEAVDHCCIETVAKYAIFLYELQTDEPPDYEKMGKYLKLAGFEGYADCLTIYLDLVSEQKIVNEDNYELGKLFEKLSSIQVDPAKREGNYLKAARYYKRGANRNHLESMFRYAQMIEEGRIKYEELENAKKLYQKAASKGHPGSTYKCAQMIENDPSSAKSDFARATELYKKAALMNYPDAMYRYARILEDICMIKSDRQKAVDLYQKATHMNHPDSMLRYADLLEEGMFVLKNHSKAVDLILKAAQMNHPESMFRYAEMLKEGMFVTADEDKSRELIKKAAFMKHPKSMIKYAEQILYQVPDPCFLELAKKMYKGAADSNNYEYASKYLKMLKDGRFGEPDKKEIDKYEKIIIELSVK